ncbi:MAG: LPS assembly lipoprotein LptE [bacterium]
MNTDSFKIISCFLILFLLAGCAGGSHSIPTNVRDLAVVPFDNSSAEPGLENILTDEIIQQLLAEGQLNLVKPEEADVILRGNIDRYRRIPMIYDERDRVQQYRVRVEINYKLIDPATDRALRTFEDIYRQSTYSEVVPPIETEYDAQERVLFQLARDVVTSVVEGWPYMDR